MLVVEYEREFVRLDKYARDIVPTKAEIYTRFEWCLNEEIQMSVWALEIKEFVTLANRA